MCMSRPTPNQRGLRKSLRGETINYRWGWFFVSFNVAENKSVFGAIAGESVSLNELGRRVAGAIADMPKFYPEVKLDAYVVMPNHVHFIIKIEDRPTNDRPFVAYVASEGNLQSPPQKLWSRAIARGKTFDSDASGTRTAENGQQTGRPPVISTFTSPSERQVLRKLLAAKRSVIKVFPGGIPTENELPGDLKLALDEKRALLLSPVETGTGLNKQRANWCNEYVLRNATEVWAGPLRPGGSLEALTNALRPSH